MIVVTVDKQTGTLVGQPEIITTAFLATPNDPRPDRRRRRIASGSGLDHEPGDHISEIALLKSQIKEGVSRYLYEQTKRRPMVFPVVVEV